MLRGSARLTYTPPASHLVFFFAVFLFLFCLPAGFKKAVQYLSIYLILFQQQSLQQVREFRRRQAILGRGFAGRGGGGAGGWVGGLFDGERKGRLSHGSVTVAARISIPSAATTTCFCSEGEM